MIGPKIKEERHSSVFNSVGFRSSSVYSFGHGNLVQSAPNPQTRAFTGGQSRSVCLVVNVPFWLRKYRCPPQIKKLTSYYDFPHLKPHFTHILVNSGILDGFIEPKNISYRVGATVTFGNRCSKGYGEWGCFCGEYEYEVSFDLSAWNGELSPSDPNKQVPANSPFWARKPERSSESNSPHNLGSAGQNLWVRGIDTQR